MAKKLRKKELGKGIRALLSNIETEIEVNPQKVVQELSSAIAMVPLDSIEVNPYQPRKDFDEVALNELVDSLKIHGLIQPITLRRLNSKSYQLIAGERRWRASKLAGLREVPAYIRIANDQEMLEMALVENIQREQLNPFEIAVTYQRLIEECDLTHEALADRVGKNRSIVSNYIRFLKLAPVMQEALKKRQISFSHARELAGIEDPSFQIALFKDIIQNDLSVKATVALIKAHGEPPVKAAPKTATMPDEYQTVEDNLRKYLGAKVNLKYKGKGKGQIVIPFGSVKDLNRLLDLIEEV